MQRPAPSGMDKKWQFSSETSLSVVPRSTPIAVIHLIQSRTKRGENLLFAECSPDGVSPRDDG
jgi:hypothetical protein